MSSRPADPAVTIAEADLAAITPTLLDQPSLWSGLALSPQALEQAGTAPWSAWWTLRLAELDDPAACRAVLEVAHASFVARGDRTGALLACAMAIETFFHELVPLEGMDPWTRRLEAHLGDPATPWPSPGCGAEVMACGIAWRVREPAHPRLAQWAERGTADVLLLSPGPPRLRLATFLLHYRTWRGEFGASALVADSLPGIDCSTARHCEAVAWMFGLAVHARYTGDIQRGLAAVNAGLERTDADRMQHHRFVLHLTGAAIALTARDAALASHHLEAARRWLDDRTPQDQANYWYTCTGLALLRGDAHAALALARSTLAQTASIGRPYGTMASRFAVAAALWEVGDMRACAEEACTAVDEARAVASSTGVFSTGLLASQALLRQGRGEAADALLAEALTVGAANDYVIACGGWLPSMVAAAMARGLERGLQTGYVRRFVRRSGLPCPDPALQAWPWPLKLRGFGRFEVLHDDGTDHTDPGTRLPQRPLDLLRALMAHDGSTLPVPKALDWLWPDADRGQQRKSFDAALLRLRRALGDESLLLLEGAHLRLDPGRCWSDVKALTDTDWSPARHAGDVDALFALGERLLGLARGPLLDGVDEPWALAARERMRQRVAFALEAIAAAIEPQSAERSCALYQRALLTDPLAEGLARRLIAAQLARGERIEALRAWTHLRALLGLRGEAPSTATLTLVRRAGLVD